MHTPEEPGACDATAEQCFGEQIAGRIVQHHHPDRQSWLKIVRASRSERDWQLLYQHRAKMSAHLDNVIVFPGRDR